MNCIISQSIIAAMWDKFAAFACLTTIATLCRSKAGAIAAAPTRKNFVDNVISEGTRIAAAEGHPISAAMSEQVRTIFSYQASTYGRSMLTICRPIVRQRASTS